MEDATINCSEIVGKWFQLEKQIKEYRETIKDWKDQQKDLAPDIKAWMKKSKVQSISTKQGTITLEVNEQLKPKKEKKTKQKASDS